MSIQGNRYRIHRTPFLLNAVGKELVEVSKPIALRDGFPSIVEDPVLDHLLANLVDGLVRKVPGKGQEVAFETNAVGLPLVRSLFTQDEGLDGFW